MKGHWLVILKDGRVKEYRYYSRAFECFYKEYGLDLKALDIKLLRVVNFEEIDTFIKKG